MSNVVALNPTQRRSALYKGARLSASNAGLGAIARLKWIVDDVEELGSLPVLMSIHLDDQFYQVAGRPSRIPDLEALAGATAMSLVERYGGYAALRVYSLDRDFDWSDFDYWQSDEV